MTGINPRESGDDRGVTPQHPAVEHILKYFTCDHLKGDLRVVALAFQTLARQVAERAPANPETTVALRKLLEAKDAAVRAVL